MFVGMLEVNDEVGSVVERVDEVRVVLERNVESVDEGGDNSRDDREVVVGSTSIELVKVVLVARLGSTADVGEREVVTPPGG